MTTVPLSPDYKTLTVEELAMRFHHPKFYQDRGTEYLDPVPDLTALSEMIRRGLIHRGIRAEEVEYLLGAPYDAPSDRPLHEAQHWKYGTIFGTLSVEFDDNERLACVWQHHDGDRQPPKTDDLLSPQQ